MNCSSCGKVLKRHTGLCWYCRVEQAKEARDGCDKVDDFDGCEADPPAFPTPYHPGTEGKVLVMEVRAFLGQELFHPMDGLV